MIESLIPGVAAFTEPDSTAALEAELAVLRASAKAGAVSVQASDGKVSVQASSGEVVLS